MVRIPDYEGIQYKLSPSSLNIFLECPVCFARAIKYNCKRPGIFPTITHGMDRVIKKYFDAYREMGLLPPVLEGKVKGRLFSDQKLMDKWRNWRSGLRYTDEESGVLLRGALDECLRDGDIYIPLDYKTRGYKLKEDTHTHYQNQLDCYCLLLDENGYKTDKLAYLAFYIPEEMYPEDGKTEFQVEIVEMETDPERARQLVKDASDYLQERGPFFSPLNIINEDCEWCRYIQKAYNECPPPIDYNQEPEELQEELELDLDIDDLET